MSTDKARAQAIVDKWVDTERLDDDWLVAAIVDFGASQRAAGVQAERQRIREVVEKLRKVGLGEYWNGRHDGINDVLQAIDGKGE